MKFQTIWMQFWEMTRHIMLQFTDGLLSSNLFVMLPNTICTAGAVYKVTKYTKQVNGLMKWVVLQVNLKLTASTKNWRYCIRPNVRVIYYCNMILQHYAHTRDIMLSYLLTSSYKFTTITGCKSLLLNTLS